MRRDALEKGIGLLLLGASWYSLDWAWPRASNSRANKTLSNWRPAAAARSPFWTGLAVRSSMQEPVSAATS